MPVAEEKGNDIEEDSATKRHLNFRADIQRTPFKRETEVQNRSLAIELGAAAAAGVQLLLQLPPSHSGLRRGGKHKMKGKT